MKGWDLFVVALAAVGASALITAKFYRDSKTLDVWGGVTERPNEGRGWVHVETMDDPSIDPVDYAEFCALEGGVEKTPEIPRRVYLGSLL